MDNNTVDTTVIRKARPEDCDEMHALIKKLAEHLGKPYLVKIDGADLRRDGFGENKLFHSFVAENQSGVLVGQAIYSLHYSPMSGVSVWLSHIYVLSEYRRRGIGTRLLREVAMATLALGSRRLEWMMTKANTTSTKFYDTVGGKNRTESDGKQLFRLDNETLEALAANKRTANSCSDSIMKL